jgi:ferredoxin
MVSAVVVAERVRCVECGICTYNCPLGVDVRTRVRLGQPVADSYCLTCGECVARCPRGTLRFESSSVFNAGTTRGGR